jgi:hypothetical protein
MYFGTTAKRCVMSRQKVFIGKVRAKNALQKSAGMLKLMSCHADLRIIFPHY